MNNALKSLQWTDGDVILQNSWTYNPVKNLVNVMIETIPGNKVKVKKYNHA